MSDLTVKKCLPCEGGVDPLNPTQCQALLQQLTGWQLNEANDEITREFNFDDFHQTMAFVNAVAWLAHCDNHHPDMKVGYNYCHMRYSTHAINGLSENDFICAAKVDALLAQSEQACELPA